MLVDAVSSTLLEARADLEFRGPALGRAGRGSPFQCEVRLGERSLWVLAKFAKRGGIALRVCYSPDARIDVAGTAVDGNVLNIELAAPLGRWRVRCEFPTRKQPVLHYSAWLTPAKSLKIPFWPRDIYPFGSGMDPAQTQGTIQTAQRGPRTGIMFASLEEPRAGTFLYVQDFSALNDYAEMTQTSPAGRVGGTWPDSVTRPRPIPSTRPQRSAPNPFLRRIRNAPERMSVR